MTVLQGCETVQTTQPGAVGITRKQQMGVSREQVDQQSAAAYAQLRQEAGQKKTLNTDPALLARVQRIANRLIPQVVAYRPDAVSWKWEVNVFQSEEVNAFCMAGGKIAVYTGLIQKLKITDDELAAVMGHEIAHALREHVREQMSRQQVLGVVGVGAVIGGALMGVNVDPQLTKNGLQVAFGLPHSRQAEVEADDIGLELAARAGYNPKAAITLWQKMGSLGGGHPPVFLSTHPSPESRAADLARVAQLVEPLYHAAIKAQPQR
jgi:predicted Zn-dependent protease